MFLPPTKEERRAICPRANRESPHATRTIHLGATHTHEINAKRLHKKRHKARCLAGIGMNIRIDTPLFIAKGAHRACNLPNRLDNANLIIRHVERYEYGVGAQCLQYLFNTNKAIAIGVKESHCASTPRTLLNRGENGRVL